MEEVLEPGLKVKMEQHGEYHRYFAVKRLWTIFIRHFTTEGLIGLEEGSEIETKNDSKEVLTDYIETEKDNHVEKTNR